MDDKVLVNGEPLIEPYKNMTPNYTREDFPPPPGAVSRYQEGGIEGWFDPFREKNEVVVPPGHYFAMGDNRDNSLDSRYWGFVPKGLIVGKPVVVYWSYEAESDAYRQTEVRDVVGNRGTWSGTSSQRHAGRARVESSDKT
jgi:signal peptidase I